MEAGVVIFTVDLLVDFEILESIRVHMTEILKPFFSEIVLDVESGNGVSEDLFFGFFSVSDHRRRGHLLRSSYS